MCARSISEVNNNCRILLIMLTPHCLPISHTTYTSFFIVFSCFCCISSCLFCVVSTSAARGKSRLWNAVWDRGLMTKPVSDRHRSWSWSYTFGLASNTVVPDKALCDMIMLKCNTHVYFFRAIRWRNIAKRNLSSYFLQLFFITNMRVATEVFSVI